MRCPFCGENISEDDFVCPNCKMDLPVVSMEDETIDTTAVEVLPDKFAGEKKLKKRFRPRTPKLLILVLIIAAVALGITKLNDYYKQYDGTYVCTNFSQAKNKVVGTDIFDNYKNIELQITGQSYKMNGIYPDNTVNNSFQSGDIHFKGYFSKKNSFSYDRNTSSFTYDKDTKTLTIEDYSGAEFIFEYQE